MNAVETVRGFLGRLEKAVGECTARLGRPIAFMEVCGTHTMSAFRSGLHSLLPEDVKLLSGPGCPVCVTAQGDIDLLVSLARDERAVTICTYGDMLRVPGRTGSLERARGEGADVRVIYSALDAVAWAKKLPEREVVLAAVGFETTAPATAAAILEAKQLGLKNFSVMASHKRVVPAMLALMESGEVKVDGFLCPGHVSVVVGADVYVPIVRDYGMPCVISGFEEMHMAGALARLAEMVAAGKAELANDYSEAVSAGGNAMARALIEKVFEVGDARWRGMGNISGSGMIMRRTFGEFDAARRLELEVFEDREPAGCLCGKVITGAASPSACRLFGKVCTPVNPIGPCMVSSEGTCAAHFKYGGKKLIADRSWQLQMAALTN